jgi:hypothetical protein
MAHHASSNGLNRDPMPAKGTPAHRTGLMPRQRSGEARMGHAGTTPAGPSQEMNPEPPRKDAAPDRGEAPSGETLEEKTRRDRQAGDVADDLADFA